MNKTSDTPILFLYKEDEKMDIEKELKLIEDYYEFEDMLCNIVDLLEDNFNSGRIPFTPLIQNITIIRSLSSINVTISIHHNEDEIYSITDDLCSVNSSESFIQKVHSEIDHVSKPFITYPKYNNPRLDAKEESIERERELKHQERVEAKRLEDERKREDHQRKLEERRQKISSEKAAFIKQQKNILKNVNHVLADLIDDRFKIVEIQFKENGSNDRLCYIESEGISRNGNFEYHVRSKAFTSYSSNMEILNEFKLLLIAWYNAETLIDDLENDPDEFWNNRLEYNFKPLDTTLNTAIAEYDVRRRSEDK